MLLPDFITREPDGYLHLTGHRIGVQEIAKYYQEGFSAEMLLAEFPTLSLSLIHKVLGFYLEVQAELDGEFAQCNAEMEKQRAAAKRGPSLETLRERLQSLTTQRAD